MILYLHGFRSSPRSFKAILIEDAMRKSGRGDQFTCPQLPVSPAAAVSLLDEMVAHHPASELCLIGSSLGGYYATWLAERHGCRAALLNPAIHPARDLARHLGRHSVYHSDEQIDFREEFIAELEALWVESLTRMERYLLVCAKGDEILDWREMVQRYRGAGQLVQEGGDHGLSNFATLMPAVLEFAS